MTMFYIVGSLLFVLVVSCWYTVGSGWDQTQTKCSSSLAEKPLGMLTRWPIWKYKERETYLKIRDDEKEDHNHSRSNPS